MRHRFSLTREKQKNGKNRIIIGFFVLLAAMLFCGQVMAFETELFGNPLFLNGYVNQTVQFGVAGDHWDTIQGFQQALTQALLEIEYLQTDDLRVFVSGQLVKDWAYDILDSNNDWGNREDPTNPSRNGRHFKESRSELSLLSDYEDYLKECNVTWTPGNLNLRIGKQIVPWGRMTAVRVMDLINPADRRKGFADVEFETSIIPIWLVKAEYFPDMMPAFLDDLGIELTFNPNADFIPNKTFLTGNEIHGIWAADSLREIAPGVVWRVGSQDFILEEPDSWNSEGYEYGFRLKGMLPDSTYFTLNFFDGVENSPVELPTYGLRTEREDDKGRPIYHFEMEGEYFDQRNVGFTVAREFESLYSNFLGGVAPVIRAEALYELDTTFSTDGKSGGDEFEEYDAIHWGISADWKINIPILNPRRYFTVEPGFIHRYIDDYPSDYKLRGFDAAEMKKNRYSITLLAMTYYLHDKLTPSLFYMRRIEGSVKGDTWRFKLDYAPNTTWRFSAMLYMLEKKGFKTIDHKDNLSFTVQYQF